MGKTQLQDDHSKEVYEFAIRMNSYFHASTIKTVLDVGSRDARESINLKKNYPHAHVYAFECNPAAIDLCKENIIGHSDITLITKAVSDTNGSTDFFAIDSLRTITPHADGNIGASSLLTANPAYPYEKYVQNKISVESTTLAQWALENRIDEIDILWIDLQGAELKAFKGMGSLIRRVKVIYTEIEFKEMYVGQPLFPEVDEYLTSQGFHLVKVSYEEWFGNAFYLQERYVHQWNKSIRMYLQECYTRSYFLKRQGKIKLKKLFKA